MKRLLLVCMLVSTLPSGCGRHAAKTQSEARPIAFKKNVDDLVIIIVLDLSPNFKAKLLGKDFREQGGPAYPCLHAILTALHQERSGQRDRLIISHIGSSDSPILWEGDMRSFSRSFENEAAFRELLKKHSNNQSGRVWDSISDSIDYALKNDRMVKGKTRMACFVLSDLCQSARGDRSESRLSLQMRTLADYDGIIGLYFVDQRIHEPWRAYLRGQGFRADQYYVGAEFTSDTPVPSFKK